MPNGGSDCCGTCWFNVKNKGEAGYEHAQDTTPDFCSIRHLSITNAFCTYCGNHPHRRPERDQTPIGPVFIGEDREIWKPSPDREDIRLHLLALLGQIEERPQVEYPIGLRVSELIVWQLGEFKEHRAVDDLKRIATFDISLVEDLFKRTNKLLVKLCVDALEKIESDL